MTTRKDTFSFLVNEKKRERVKKDYQYYCQAFQGREMPFAFVDLDLFDENIRQVLARADGKKQIRVASKSIRCIPLIRRLLAFDTTFQGIMCYSAHEAVFLSEAGFDDLLVAYPAWHEQEIAAVCLALKRGKAIVLTVDCLKHVEHLDAIGRAHDIAVPVCMDVDMSSSILELYFGARRSGIAKKEDALTLAEHIRKQSHVTLTGVLTYEGQIAGVPDNLPGQAPKNHLIRLLKRISTKELNARRNEIITALGDAGHELTFVNGGGTGSIEMTREQACVTEITVGSAFFAPSLFDHFTNFRHLSAAGYAIEIVRQPTPTIFTCRGGGYPASGSPGREKLPVPYLPEGATLLGMEGAGEVQTPVVYDGPENLRLGGPIFLRHSKAGELCERFNSLYLISDGGIHEEVSTYRGQGKCFL